MTRSEAELWATRARAAEDAATQLTQLREDLSNVLRRYHFGIDCVEGEELHAALLSSFAAEGEVLTAAAADAQKLASDCRHAAQSLADADAMNAEGFTRAGPR